MGKRKESHHHTLLDLQLGADEPFLKTHRLDKPLWWPRPRKPNETELARQTEYLLEHHRELPITTARRRALEILSVYIAGKIVPPFDIVLLIGTLIEVGRIQWKYAKLPEQREWAFRLFRENPEASNQEIGKEIGVARKTVWDWRKRWKESEAAE